MEFPFRDRAGKSPLHEKVLLLEMNGTLFQKFAIGYYDAIRDVFHVWESGHLPSDGYLCGEWPVGEPYEGIWCPMPKKSSQEVGERRIKSWMEMPAALDDMKKLDVMEEDMDKVLEKSGCCQQYLVCTDDWKLTICEVSSFTGDGERIIVSYEQPCAEVQDTVCREPRRMACKEQERHVPQESGRRAAPHSDEGKRPLIHAAGGHHAAAGEHRTGADKGGGRTGWLIR